jgi:hypothetical protein
VTNFTAFCERVGLELEPFQRKIARAASAASSGGFV